MYEDRVERGAALLDRARPGWEREISLDDLAMSRCDHCILGQLYGQYWTGVQAVRPLVFGESRSAMWKTEHGFTLPLSDGSFGWLADAWRALIRRRLAAASGA
jgi:hypothetical protein